MAANALIQARIDGKLKHDAAAVLASVGLTVSDAIRLRGSDNEAVKNGQTDHVHS